jgi:hypothetical protein
MAIIAMLAVPAAAMPPKAAATQQKIEGFTGVIQQITVTELLFGGKTSMKASVVLDDGLQIELFINNKVLIANQSGEIVNIKSLQDASAVYVAYTPKRKTPNLMPDVIVILNEGSGTMYKYDYFNANGLSADNSLDVTLTQQTRLTDRNNQPVSIDDVINKPLLVFYDTATGDNPPQAVPFRAIMVK